METREETIAKIDYAPCKIDPRAERIWTCVWRGAWWTLIGVAGLCIMLAGFLWAYCRYVDPTFLD